MYYKRVQAIPFLVSPDGVNHRPSQCSEQMSWIRRRATQPFIFQPMDEFVDPRYEDEALSALMEEAFSETKEEKFDVESYLNGEIDYA